MAVHPFRRERRGVIRRAAGAALLVGVALAATRDARRSARPPREPEGDAAREYRLSGMRDEHGRIEPQRGVAARAALRRDAAPRPEALFPHGLWVSRHLQGHAGRARSLVIHPSRPEVMWLGASSGGIWKTENGGASWRPLTDDIGLPTGCLVADPRDPDRLLWGTGERFHSGGPGAGIWESPDGGESWRQMPATATWPYVSAIVVSAADPRLLVVAAPSVTSTDGGIYRSTDGGATWSAVLHYDPVAFDVFADPSDASRLLASSRARRTSTFPTSCVFRSTDAGASWTFSAGSCAPDDGFGVNPMALAFAPSDPRIVYAVSRVGLLRSEDGGATFAVRNGANPGFVARWTGTLWVSPLDPSFLIVGGGSLARSTDGGATFIRFDAKRPNDAAGHADTQRVVSVPGFGASHRRLYVLNDGGIDVLDDALAASPSVTSLDANLATTEVWGAGGSAAAGFVIGALQDTAFQGVPFRTSRAPYVPGEGDGTHALFDGQDARYAYASTQGPNPFRISFTGLGEPLWQSLHDEEAGDAAPPNFVSPMLLDPSAPWRMLVGAHSLWRSEDIRDAHAPDRPAAWSEIKPRLTVHADFDENVLSAVAVAPHDSNVVWVAYNGGRVERTSDGTSASPRWEVVDDSGATADPLPNRRSLRILIDERDGRRVLVAFGGFSSDNLWLTNDAGATWSRRTGAAASLPAAPIWALAQHPLRRETIYAGTEVGVFQSDDFGGDWRSIGAGLPRVAAQDLSFVQGTTTLLVGTFGRGLWTLETERVPCLCRPERADIDAP
jgi:photosystem II stability/assembly factor-like uncharacterized protein